MGHTVWSQRIALQNIIHELKEYGRLLSPEDMRMYEELLKIPLRRVANISNASSIHVWAFLILSIQVEHEKRMREIEHALSHRRVSEQREDYPLDENAA